MIKTIIVEDQIKKSDDLNTLLKEHFPEIEVLKTCNTFKDAVTEVTALQPQLIFLDVELDNDYTGFDLLEQTRAVNYKVIFTTSFNKYAAKAFRFCAIDYIEGLYEFKELNEAINKYKAQTSLNGSDKNIDALLHYAKHSNNIQMQKVGIPVINGWEFITVSEIIYCRAKDNCTDFHLTCNQKLTATKTLKWVNELMQEHNFSRVHDSCLINLNHIKKYKKGGEGGLVELTDQHEVDVSRRRKDDFLKALSNLNMIFNK